MLNLKNIGKSFRKIWANDNFDKFLRDKLSINLSKLHKGIILDLICGWEVYHSEHNSDNAGLFKDVYLEYLLDIVKFYRKKYKKFDKISCINALIEIILDEKYAYIKNNMVCVCVCPLNSDFDFTIKYKNKEIK